MAIVTRYFSTAAAGAGDGTTWADRAVLFTAGAWSTVITGFNFSGSDSLECRIGPGTHTVTVAMASGLFANPPSTANPIVFHGCDSSGNLLESPDPGWVSPAIPYSTTTLPEIATTTNIATSTLAAAVWRLIYFTASGRNGAMFSGGGNFDFTPVTDSTNNSAANVFTAPANITNAWILMSGASFDSGISGPATDGKFSNIRIDGTSGTSSGTRRGITTTSTGYTASGITVIGCAGGGAFAATGSATRASYLSRCTLVDNGSFGIQCNGTASQTVYHDISNCYFSGNTYGINANGSRTIAVNNRLRDSTSGNFANFGNYPTDYNYTTDSDDATEFVDSGAGDYRIKNTATIWGKGYGAGDETSAGGGGSALHLGSLGQTGIGAF